MVPLLRPAADHVLAVCMPCQNDHGLANPNPNPDPNFNPNFNPNPNPDPDAGYAEP